MAGDGDPLFPNVIAAGAPGSPGGIGRHVRRYAMSYFRAACYITLAALANFQDTFGGLTPEQISKLSTLQWAALVISPLKAALVAAIAFLDQSLARAAVAPPATAPQATANPPAP